MTVTKYIFMWITGLIFLYVCYLLIPVFTPFLVAGILAYLGNPLVEQLERYKLSRTTAVSIVFFLISLIIILLLFILTPLLIDQLISFINQIPRQVEWLQSVLLPKIKASFQMDNFSVSNENISSTLKSSINFMSNAATNILSILSNSSSKLINILTNLFLIPVLTFYIMRDSNRLGKTIEHFLPLRNKAYIINLANESNIMLGGFLRGQLSVMVALSLIYSIGLSLTGLQFGLLIGMIAGLVSFVPYLGFIVGIVIASIAAWFQFADFKYILIVFSVFGIGQILESFVLTPKLVGDKLGMHPIAIIFALMVGGQLFGFFGLLLALPSCAILMVLLQHSVIWYKNTKFYRF